MTTPIALKRRYYISNVLRFRVLFWTVCFGALPAWGASSLGWPGWLVQVIFWVFALFALYHWTTVQMACRHCATILRLTRLSGPQSRCQKCGQLTDAAADKEVLDKETPIL